MPDVAGKGALLVDPFSIKSMREGLEKLISDSKLRETLINEGFENTKRFLPEVVADQFLKLYSSLLPKGK
jgi:glycosyltransferase involved in cell wall biosynthesis